MGIWEKSSNLAQLLGGRVEIQSQAALPWASAWECQLPHFCHVHWTSCGHQHLVLRSGPCSTCWCLGSKHHSGLPTPVRARLHALKRSRENPSLKNRVREAWVHSHPLEEVLEVWADRTLCVCASLWKLLLQWFTLVSTFLNTTTKYNILRGYDKHYFGPWKHILF